ncbi:hypothetical protein [Bremerella cremea]|uniref:hypothetical protein n=1 Tax=Bremerella cremea TaxID=1031537 RepID=UPI0031F08CBB
MHRMTFYPLGNADCCLIDLENEKKILFDFGDQGDPDDLYDKRIDLCATLRKNMEDAGKDTYDVVAITHLDDDHTCKADTFFHLDYAKKYQGEGRFKIEVLWVPAGVITETRNGLGDGAKALQAEARHRLKKGYGIRVFSRPAALKDWLEDNDLTIEEREHLITDAGNVAEELTLLGDGIEFFVHSPFATRQNGALFDRNRDSLVMQATFEIGGAQTKAILGSDADHNAWTEIVDITKYHNREYRLEWDIFKLPHHCSYLSIGPEKGEDKTAPVENVEWLFETKGNDRCIIVSPSKPIPVKGTDEDDDPQPPHRQAKKYYCEEVVNPKDGEWKVTMEHPSKGKPEPIAIEIDSNGATLKKAAALGAASLVSRDAPRAG